MIRTSLTPMNNQIFRFAGEPLSGRDRHKAGLTLLEKLYREAVGQPLPAISRAPGGKPYFVGNPLYFSISHSKNHVFCALSRVPVGIDAEESDRRLNPGLADRILSPDEKIRWQAEADQRTALLKFWVLKEAAAKLSGEGLHGYPNHTDFSPDDPRVCTHSGCLVAILTKNDKESFHAV